jgi:hypothetical protein
MLLYESIMFRLNSADEPSLIIYQNDHTYQIGCSPGTADSSVSAVDCINLNHCNEIDIQCSNGLYGCKDAETSVIHSEAVASCSYWYVGADCVIFTFTSSVPLNGMLQCKIRDIWKRWIFFTSLTLRRCTLIVYVL